MMTVPELRNECRRLGLPVYQRAGRRLRKADLIRQIRRHESATYRVAPAPKRKPQSTRIPAKRRTDDDRLVRQLAAMPTTPAETMAIYRMLAGTATAKHNGILRRREAQACQRLAERARTEKSRQKWHGRYLAATGQSI